MRIKNATLFLLTSLATHSASAAIFDAIESVDTLKVIAAQKKETGGRMPAGNVSDPSQSEAKSTEDAEKTKTPVEEKKN